MATHILSNSKLEKLHNLGVYGAQGFLEVVGEIVVNFFVGDFFIFYFFESIFVMC